jgi:hypothetical protein
MILNVHNVKYPRNRFFPSSTKPSTIIFALCGSEKLKPSNPNYLLRGFTMDA